MVKQFIYITIVWGINFEAMPTNRHKPVYFNNVVVITLHNPCKQIIFYPAEVHITSKKALGMSHRSDLINFPFVIDKSFNFWLVGVNSAIKHLVLVYPLHLFHDWSSLCGGQVWQWGTYWARPWSSECFPYHPTVWAGEQEREVSIQIPKLPTLLFVLW